MITMMKSIKLWRSVWRIPVLSLLVFNGWILCNRPSHPIFSDSNNVRPSWAGGLFRARLSDVQIGTSGPWHGTYNGILGALAAPKLEVKPRRIHGRLGHIVQSAWLESALAA